MSWKRLRQLAFFAGLPLILLLLLPLAGSTSSSIQYQSNLRPFNPALQRWLTQSSSTGYRTQSANTNSFYQLNDLLYPAKIFQPRMSFESMSKQLAALTGGIKTGWTNSLESNLAGNTSLTFDDFKFSLSSSLGLPRFFFPNNGINGIGGFAGGFGSGGIGTGGTGGSGGSGGGKGPETIFKPEYLEPPDPSRSPGIQNDPRNDGNLPEDSEVIPTIAVPEPQSWILAFFGFFSLIVTRFFFRNR
jgi:hypothetical protein